jgi:hypothetical protein
MLSTTGSTSGRPEAMAALNRAARLAGAAAVEPEACDAADASDGSPTKPPATLPATTPALIRKARLSRSSIDIRFVSSYVSGLSPANHSVL